MRKFIKCLKSFLKNGRLGKSKICLVRVWGGGGNLNDRFLIQYFTWDWNGSLGRGTTSWRRRNTGCRKRWRWRRLDSARGCSREAGNSGRSSRPIGFPQEMRPSVCRRIWPHQPQSFDLPPSTGLLGSTFYRTWPRSRRYVNWVSVPRFPAETASDLIQVGAEFLEMSIRHLKRKLGHFLQEDKTYFTENNIAFCWIVNQTIGKRLRFLLKSFVVAGIKIKCKTIFGSNLLEIWVKQ